MRFTVFVTCGLLIAACTPEVRPPASAPPTPASSCPPAIAIVGQPGPELEVVLEAVALPTGNVLQANPTGDPDWLFAKQGLFVRSDRAVTITVDPAAAEWARIGWSSTERATEFSLPACSSDDRWRVYAGGYSVRSEPRCLPLTVRVGEHSVPVKIGVGVCC